MYGNVNIVTYPNIIESVGYVKKSLEMYGHVGYVGSVGYVIGSVTFATESLASIIRTSQSKQISMLRMEPAEYSK